jgi:hypothetical protein
MLLIYFSNKSGNFASIIASIGNAANQLIADTGQIIVNPVGKIHCTIYHTNQAKNIFIQNIIKLNGFHLLTLYK